MTIDLNTISNVLSRARGQLSGPGAPMYLNHEQKRAWRDGFNFCIETFVQTALHVTRELVLEQEMREDREAAADPSYDRIDHLMYREERWGLSPAERQELRGDHKRLRAAEKAGRRPKVDPKQHIVVFHGEHTGKMNRITQIEPEVNRENRE